MEVVSYVLCLWIQLFLASILRCVDMRYAKHLSIISIQTAPYGFIKVILVFGHLPSVQTGEHVHDHLVIPPSGTTLPHTVSDLWIQGSNSWKPTLINIVLSVYSLYVSPSTDSGDCPNSRS
jgi:hypothetical protein